MTAAEISAKAQEKLRGAGLLPFIYAEKSQFLDSPEGFFMEIVVRDGNKLADVRRVLDEMSKEISEPLDAIVRAIWQVAEVGDPVVPYSMETGTPRTSLQYPAVLRAGEKEAKVAVDVTYLAQQALKDLGYATQDEIKNVVRLYVEKQLSRGGASYWDPEKTPYLEVNGAAVSYLLSRGDVKPTKTRAIM